MRKSPRNSMMIKLKKQHMKEIQENSKVITLENGILNANSTTQLNHTVLCGFHETAKAELYQKTA